MRGIEKVPNMQINAVSKINNNLHYSYLKAIKTITQWLDDYGHEFRKSVLFHATYNIYRLK